MSKRIEIDGEFYRMRKGKLVRIPGEWVGRVPDPQTIRKRRSKWGSQARRNMSKRFPGFSIFKYFKQKFRPTKVGRVEE